MPLLKYAQSLVVSLAKAKKPLEKVNKILKEHIIIFLTNKTF